MNRKMLVDYAMSWLLVPYRWGGSSFRGVDCSGFVQEILTAAGIDPIGDQTAQALFDHFRTRAFSDVLEAGALAFFGRSESSITHVAMLVDRQTIIEAGGGGRDCLTVDDAAVIGAMVRLRPLRRRTDLIAVLMPDYSYVSE